MLLPILGRREIRRKGFSETVLKEVVPGRAELMWKVYTFQSNMYTHSWFMAMYGKNHHNIVKYLASN